MSTETKERARDDFSGKTRDMLGRRAGFRCSNPDCRRPTSGPRQDSEKSVDVGVGAHICAAAEGGPRFDATMTADERSSIKNGLWLCQVCAKLVDNDEARFTAGLLETWKDLAEASALLALQNRDPITESSDVELLRFYSQCLDRPAFQDSFHIEGSMEDFDRAIEDTITAINTGCLYDRRGTIIAQAKGKSFLKRHEWRREMDMIVDLLRAIRSRYECAVRKNEIHLGVTNADGSRFYCINNREVSHWMDETRGEVLELFSRLCVQAGMPALRFPRHHAGRW